jgi:CRISPR-associated protein Csb2
MTSFVIAWEYLTGRVVATDPTNRERSEWPPHPGRVFMALAAAWFETGEDPAEGEALRWLERLGDPELRLPAVEPAFERSLVKVYVPINGDDGRDIPVARKQGKKIARYTRPENLPLKRLHVERTFPSVWVGHGPCCLVWPNENDADLHGGALDRLCAKVTRIGHSSSMVRMWVTDGLDAETWSHAERWTADDTLADTHLRGISVGTLALLAERWGGPTRLRHESHIDRIGDLESRKKDIKGKGAREHKAEIEAEVASLKEEAQTVDPRPPLRPTLGLWSGFRRPTPHPGAEALGTHFDTDLLVLVREEGPDLPLASTLALTRTVRGAVISQCGVTPAPAWVSGHESDGNPLQDEGGHLAFIPLPFVGRRHADGHILGLGLAFPRSVERRERGRVLGPLLVEPSGEAKPVELKLGRLGVWMLRKRHWTERRRALRPESWTAHPTGARIWASVTPVVLDRFPKSDRQRHLHAWRDEVVSIISAGCRRIGLPEPAVVDIDTTCWHLGSPRATSKRRSIRVDAGVPRDASVAFGDGFPPFPPRGTNASRPQIHVWLEFDEPVLGPLLLSAGRYLGYGLCKPWREQIR